MAWNTWSQDSDSYHLYCEILGTSKGRGRMKTQVQSSVPIVFSWLGWVGDVDQLRQMLAWCGQSPGFDSQRHINQASVDSLLTCFAPSLSTVQWSE